MTINIFNYSSASHTALTGTASPFDNDSYTRLVEHFSSTQKLTGLFRLCGHCKNINVHVGVVFITNDFPIRDLSYINDRQICQKIHKCLICS